MESPHEGLGADVQIQSEDLMEIMTHMHHSCNVSKLIKEKKIKKTPATVTDCLDPVESPVYIKTTDVQTQRDL